MAGSPRETIDRLRVHVDELMARHTALIERCECLEVRLQENIHAKYRSLAMAQAVALQEGDWGAARSRFDKLVREIDKCISLLNE